MDRPDRPRDQPGPPPRPGSAEDIRARLDRLPRNRPSSPYYRRAHDTPRQPDQQPERQRPWYAPHAIREHHIERQRREQAPAADPQRWRADWYRQHEGDVPAPFRLEVAERVPATSRGTNGRLDRHDGGPGLPLDSGYKTGLVDALEHRLGQLPDGFTTKNKTHVEAHAAAWLHLNPRIREATLYLNRRPCPDGNGCRERLPAMLPGGTRLTIYAPDGRWYVYHGQPSTNQEGP
jgi:hypothetical protein